MRIFIKQETRKEAEQLGKIYTQLCSIDSIDFAGTTIAVKLIATHDNCSTVEVKCEVEEPINLAAQTKSTRTTYEKLSFKTIGEAVDYANQHDVYIKKDDRYCELKLRDSGSVFTKKKHYFGSVVAHFDNLYHKVEKEIDWRDDIKSYFESSSKEAGDFEGMEVTNTSWRFRYNPSDEEFLEMCRIALRATGELK